MSCNYKIVNTVSSPRFMRSIVSAIFFLKYFMLSKCVCLCVCSAVAFGVAENLSNVGRVVVVFIRCHSVYKSWICINLIVASCIFVESLQFINQRMHIKFHIKHFKTLRHVSILSVHHQGALFLAKVILQYSQFSSYLQTSCCGSISCCVGMCCGAVHELNCEYCNLTLARNKAP